MENVGLDCERKGLPEDVLAVISNCNLLFFLSLPETFRVSCLGPGALGGFLMKNPQETQARVSQESASGGFHPGFYFFAVLTGKEQLNSP